MRYLAYVFCVLVISGCSTLPTSFTTENVMKLKQGMKSEEVLKMFGNPKKISQAVCGEAGERWTCTTWEYGEFPYERASFTFSGEPGAYVLNNFSIDK